MSGETMRIQRALARAGIASRRGAEELVAAGRVTVNGEVARTGQSVDPATDTILVDGKPIAAPREQHVWIVLNKPTGVLTSRPDGTGRKTVFDLVREVPGLTYVGRLDYMTEGVLLLTTDGDAAHALTHPSRQVERRYIATVRGDAESAALEAERGVPLEDGVVRPRDVTVRNLRRGVWELALTIREGKTHEVRRLCEALGLDVLGLLRTRFGPVELGDLPAGGTRPVLSRERRAIDAIVQSGGGERPARPVTGRSGSEPSAGRPRPRPRS